MHINPNMLNTQSAADQPLEKLAGNTALSQSDKVAELSRQFEAILLRQVITEAQKPAFPSKFNPQSTASGIRQDMMASQLADNITRAGGLGLGRQLEQDLNRQLGSASSGPTAEEADYLPGTTSYTQRPRWKPSST